MMADAGAQKASGWASTAASPCNGPKGSVNNGIAGTLIPCPAGFKPNMIRGAARQAPSHTASTSAISASSAIGHQRT